MKFYVGVSDPYMAIHFERAFLSVNRLRRRVGDFEARDWIMDSGAFTEISTFGRYRHSTEEYASQIRRWRGCGNLVAAVAQDWMCEPWILQKTGLTVLEHQRLTVQRLDELVANDPGVEVMPVLQGFAPADYVRHLELYGDRLGPGRYVGVGSVCKRNGDPAAVLEVLDAIHAVRPDLRLHGFGVKSTSLACPAIVARLYSADSMAWSFAARKQGRDPNDWQEARRFEERILEAVTEGARPVQTRLAL